MCGVLRGPANGDVVNIWHSGAPGGRPDLEDVRGGIDRLGVCVLRSDSWMSNLQTQRGQGESIRETESGRRLLGRKVRMCCVKGNGADWMRGLVCPGARSLCWKPVAGLGQRPRLLN